MEFSQEDKSPRKRAKHNTRGSIIPLILIGVAGLLIVVGIGSYFVLMRSNQDRNEDKSGVPTAPTASPPRTATAKTKTIPTKAPVPAVLVNATWDQVLTRFKELIPEKVKSEKLIFEKKVTRLPGDEREQVELSMKGVTSFHSYPPSINVILAAGGREYLSALSVQELMGYHDLADWLSIAKRIWLKRNPIPYTPESIKREAEWLHSLSVAPTLCDGISRPHVYQAIDNVLNGKDPGNVVGDPDVYKRIVREIP